MKVIGIAGKKRSGKDTAAGILVRESDYRRLSFASILKSMTSLCLTRLGIDPTTAQAMIDGDLKEMPVPQLCGKSTRHAMQTLGTEWGRNCIDENFWVQATLRQAMALGKAVISDVRFANEAQAIREAGGKVIRVVRDIADNNGDNHPSEVMDFDVDHTIFNNGTIDQLKEELLNYERKL